jgi:heme A synthase
MLFMFTRGVRDAWSTLIWIVLFMLPVEFYLAGYGAVSFTHGTTTTRNNDWGAHMAFGSIIGLVVILVLITGLASRLPRQLTGMTVGLFVLMIVQFVLGVAGDSAPVLAALHPVNALLITGLTMSLALRSRAYLPFGRFKAAASTDGSAPSFADH